MKSTKIKKLLIVLVFAANFVLLTQNVARADQPKGEWQFTCGSGCPTTCNGYFEGAKGWIECIQYGTDCNFELRCSCILTEVVVEGGS